MASECFEEFKTEFIFCDIFFDYRVQEQCLKFYHVKKIDQTSPKIAVIFKLCQILPISSKFANNYKAFEKKKLPRNFKSYQN